MNRSLPPLLIAGLLALTACTNSPQAAAPSPQPSTNQSLQSENTPTPAEETTSEPPQATESQETAEPTEEPDPVEPSPSASLTPPVNDGYRVDPAAAATTDLVTGNPVDTQDYDFPEADQPSVVFQSPDGKVACLMQPYGAFCLTDDSVNWVLLSLSMGPGDTQPRSIQAQGRSATHPWFATGHPLKEGDSLTWMGMTCTSTGESSVQCNDGSHGFNLSDADGR